MTDIVVESIKAFAVHFFTEGLRYIFFAGITFTVFWVVLRSKLTHRIIQKKLSSNNQLIREFLFSMSSIAIFSFISVGIYWAVKNGYTTAYKDIHKYGTLYFILSFPLSVIIHDTYFYWTHRLMHHPKLYKHIHLIHHQSTNPSPWAAYSFHPYEAIIQALIGPILVLVVPMHVYTLIFFGIYQITYNVFGHLSFELFPKGFTRNKFTFWHNTTTHHNMHHRYFYYNYTIYFNVWDRIMGTLHPSYDATFDEVTHREPEVNDSTVVTHQA